MKKIFSSVLGFTLLLSPVVSFAAQDNSGYNAPERDFGVNLSVTVEELTDSTITDVELIGTTWYFLAEQDGASTLYGYDTTLQKVAVHIPQLYQNYDMTIVDIGSYFGSPTLTVARHAKTDAHTLIGYHFFFPNTDFSYLWELPLPDNWIIHDVHYGHTSLMFDVEKIGSAGRFLYNYLWPDDVFLVSSFSEYTSFSLTSTEYDEWVIKACTDVTSLTYRCDWFRYGANKILAPLVGLPAGFTPVQAAPHTDGIDFGILGLIGSHEAAVVVRPVDVNPGEVVTTAYYTGDFSELEAVLVSQSVVSDIYERTLIIIEGQLFVINEHDTDGDGLADGVESAIGSNPAVADTDSDGFTDFEELATGFNPSGPCQVKSFEGPVFRYGRGFVPQEQHECYDAYLKDALAHRLGFDWKLHYSVTDDEEANILFAFMYGDYPINELIGKIISKTPVDTAQLYTATR